jgi:hypothetical protein
MGNIIAKKSVLQNYRSINYYFVANPTKIILACQEFTLEKKKTTLFIQFNAYWRIFIQFSQSCHRQLGGSPGGHRLKSIYMLWVDFVFGMSVCNHRLQIFSCVLLPNCLFLPL